MPLGNDKKTIQTFSHFTILKWFYPNDPGSTIYLVSRYWFPKLVQNFEILVELKLAYWNPSMKISLLKLENLIVNKAIELEKLKKIEPHVFMSSQWPIYLKWE